MLVRLGETAMRVTVDLPCCDGRRGEQRPPREAGTSRRHRLGAAATHKELSAECWGMGVEVWLAGATSGFGEYQLCPVKW